MSHSDLFAIALSEIAAILGVEQLAFDDDAGIVNLEIKEIGDLVVHRDESRVSLIFVGVIAPVSEDLLTALAADLLALSLAPMYAKVPCLGYDEETNLLMAYQVYPLRENERSGALGTAFTDFIEYLESMQRLVRQPLENLERHQARNLAMVSGIRA